MKVLLLSHDYYPNFGGVANVLINIHREFEKGKDTIYIFNPYSKDKKVFDDIINNEYQLKDYPSFLRKRKSYLFSLLAFWNILKDKKIPFWHKLKK